MTTFDRLMHHLREARALAAELQGGAVMTNCDVLHELIDEAVDYGASECFYIPPPTGREKREMRDEDEERDRVLGESVAHFINGR